jgi:hypothetical protein
MAEPAERLGRLEERMDRVEAGVSNFRGFQAEARDFFTESRTRAAVEMQFHNKRDQEIKEALKISNDERNESLAKVGLAVAKKSLLWNVVGGLLGMAALAIGIMAIAVTLYVAKHADTEPIKLLVPSPIGENILAHSDKATQDAGLPPTYAGTR